MPTESALDSSATHPVSQQPIQPAASAARPDWSPYRAFSIEQWAALRAHTPLSLSESELDELRGRNERVSLREVEQVYLPLSRLLSLYVASVQQLNVGVSRFMDVESGKVPFIIGIAGSVAVGKSTVARLLQALLARWPEHPKVDLVSTDGFLMTTKELEERDLMARKGFPESFRRGALLQFLHDVKSGRSGLQAPRYSHLKYDIVPNEFTIVDQPDILIVEGLNVLQSPAASRGTEGAQHASGEQRPSPVDASSVFVSDYFDFSLYIDADTDAIQQWYVDRFLSLRSTVFNQPDAYFSHYAKLDTDEARSTAERIWNTINRVNLEQNILPTRDRAKLILHKGSDHAIDSVKLRKL